MKRHTGAGLALAAVLLLTALSGAASAEGGPAVFRYRSLSSAAYDRVMASRGVRPEPGSSAAFACACAREIGLTQLGRFPDTADAGALRRELLGAGAAEYGWTQGEAPEACAAEPDDLLFYQREGELRCGIVICADSESLLWAEGDGAGLAELCSDLPGQGRLVRWRREQDALLPCLGYLCREAGFRPAAAVGVLANILYESGFDPRAVGDDGTSYGLCQWHRERWTALEQVCESRGLDWRGPEGQLYFLCREMEGYPELRERMNAQPQTPEGAAAAAALFCIGYECPDNAQEKAAVRGSAASGILFPALLGPAAA